MVHQGQMEGVDERRRRRVFRGRRRFRFSSDCQLQVRLILASCIFFAIKTCLAVLCFYFLLDITQP